MSQTIPLSQPSSNPRKIPTVVFFVRTKQEHIGELVAQYGAEQLLKQLNELYSKYKFMEAQLQRSRQVLKAKLPDITNALEMVEFLQNKEEDLLVDFQLSDCVWTKAEVPRTNSVALWLGANVMLEYPHQEAKDLLVKNLANAETALRSTDEDLRFLKEQIMTYEVNLSRVYNYTVILAQISTSFNYVNSTCLLYLFKTKQLTSQKIS